MSLKEKLKERKGSSLIIVVMLLAVAAVLGTAMATVAMNNYRTSRDQYYHKQAYYTARSALQSFITSLDTTDTKSLLKNATMPITGTGSLENMGKYTVKIENLSGDGKTLLVTATGIFSDASESISAILSGEDNAIIPTEFAFYSLGEVTFSGGDQNGVTHVEGNTYFNSALSFGPHNRYEQIGNSLCMGSLAIQSSNKYFVTGKLICTGALSGASHAEVTDGIYSTQASGNGITHVDEADIGIPQSMRDKVRDWNVNYYGFEQVSGDMVLANGVKLDYATNKIIMTDKSEVDFGYRNFTMGTYKDPDGNTRYNINESISLANGAVADFPNYTLTLEDGTVIKQDRTTAYVYPAGTDTEIRRNASTSSVTVSFTTEDGTRVNNLNGSLCIVFPNGDVLPRGALETGALKSRTAGAYKITQRLSDSDVLLDTTDGDIRFFVESDIEIPQNASIEIKGPHNVYFYLQGHSVVAKDSADIGKPSTLNTQTGMICFVSNDATTTVDLQGKSSFRGIIYLTKGAYKETGNVLLPYSPKIKGSVTAGTIALTRGNQYINEKPNELEFDSRLGDGYFIYSPNASASLWNFQKFVRRTA